VTGDGDRDGPGDAAPEDERDDRPELDVDAAFAAIVAEFARPAATGVGPWPAAEDLDDEADADDDADDDDATDAAGGRAPGAGATPADLARFRASRRGPRHRLPDGSDLPDDLADLADLDGLADGTGDARGDGHDRDEDPHDRFVPPDAPPITSTDLVSRLAWLGVLGGPLLLLVAALVSHTLPTLVVLAALGGFIGGFVTLVARLPRDRHDDGDDGAIV